MRTLHDEFLLTCPSMDAQPYCAFCGSTFGIEGHHVVPRRKTTKCKTKGPVVYLCRRCHERHHNHSPFHFDYSGGWYADGKPLTTHDW